MIAITMDTVRDLIERHSDHISGNTREFYNGAYAEIADELNATLGRQRAKAHPYGYEPDTGAFNATRCECGCLNDISATYCNDCGGEIEIDENADKEIYEGRNSVFAVKHDDGSLEFCERRYVPEDAATLGERYTREDVESAFVSGYSLGTLPVGSDPQWDENRQTVDEHMAELGWVRAATLGNELNPDGLPVGLTISEDGELLNWRGVNYVKQSTLGGGECEMEYGGDVTEGTARVMGVYFCSECGSPNYNDCMPYHCIYCGKAVKR